MVCALLEGWRQVNVMNRRTRHDFAELLKDLVDDDFPNKKIVLGLGYGQTQPPQTLRLV